MQRPVMAVAIATATLLLLAVRLPSSSGAKVTLVPVMSAGATSVGCTQGGCKYAAFRIPGLVSVGNRTLIAFAEGRKFGCGDFGPPPPPGAKGFGQHDLVMRRSTDGGQGWGQLTTILDALSFPPWKDLDAESRPDNGNAAWDPTPLWDRDTDTVWLFFNGPARERADCNAGACSTWATHSTNQGLSWSLAKNMTLQCQRKGALLGGLAGSSPGNGHGVQLSSGRLVVPMADGASTWGDGGGRGKAGASICYSDNHGASWTPTPLSFGTTGKADEPEVAELNGGEGKHLYMTIRNDDATQRGQKRQFATSSDGGMTWQRRLNVQVPDPGCKGSVVQAPEANALVLSTAASCAGRFNQTVFLSTDNGKPGSWKYRQLVHIKSGYSTLQMTDSGRLIAVLFEQGGCELTLGLIDPQEMIADGPRGAIPCADAQCPRGAPPPPSPNPQNYYCTAPPLPPPSPACQRVLDEACHSATRTSGCDIPTPWYPGGLPLVARYSGGCAEEPAKPWPHGLPQGPCRAASPAKQWRCYSALSLNSNRTEWSNSALHPNAYCSGPGRRLAELYSHCTPITQRAQ
eukprot:SAG22_NODE_1709_length_3761_cov_9.920535_1_plen_573_part_00